MKKLNKKGFTLVELLAVIVVLSVIMLLAVNAIVPRMNSARKNAFVTEAQVYLKAAETWYQNQLLQGVTPARCVTVETLNNGYVNKDSNKYVGSVEVKKDANGKMTYTIWISNDEFQITGKTSANLSTNGESQVDDYTADASTTCS